MSTTQFVEMYHPLIPSTATAPAMVAAQAVDERYAKGWLLVDPDALPPVPSTPYYTTAAADSRFVRQTLLDGAVADQIDNTDSETATRLRAASVAAVEDADTVAPSGVWDFEKAPTVAGVAIGTGSGSVPDATPTTKGIMLLGAANGAASLDSTGKVPQAQIPAIALTEFLGAVASQAAMLALTGQRGDWCTRTDLGTDWQLIAEPSTTLASWRQMTYPASPVSSVAGRTGAVTIAAADVTDSTATGRSVLTAADAAAARTAIGAGTSSLALGTTAATAAAGNHTHTATAIGAAPLRATRTTQTGAAYSFVVGDANTLVEGNSASAQTFTVPQNTFTAEDTIVVRQYGTGQITLAAGTGTTARSRGGALKTAGQYAEVTLTFRTANEFIVSGDVTT